MDRQAWMDRIVVEPKRHGGEPCIKGIRILVSPPPSGALAYAEIDADV